MQGKEVTFLGDIALNGLISTQSNLNKKRFEKVSQLLQMKDFVFANLEFPIQSQNEFNELKTFFHVTDRQSTIESLITLNIGCVSLANNHAFDFNMPGLRATIELLDELGIAHTGAGWLQEHIEPVVIKPNEKSIAFMAFVDKSTNPKTENFPDLKINYLEEELIIQKIEEFKDNVDQVVLSLHWGNDYSRYYTKKQQKQARKFSDAGADIIIGHHPHTLQGYEQYKNRHIFYSLGQLCFGDFIWGGNLRALKRKTKKGAIVSIKNDQVIIDYTKEHKGNYVSLIGKDNGKMLLRLNRKTQLTFKNEAFRRYVHIKESVFDRLYEIAFGYYRNPFSTVFKKSSWKKINIIKRDFAK